jgi:hypothetical protein
MKEDEEEEEEERQIELICTVLTGCKLENPMANMGQK